MMRGGMRLGNVQMQKQMQSNFSKMGEQLEKESLVKLKDQLESFSKNLSEFSLKYKDEIKYNPDFREKFYIMCKEIGVDPLSSTTLWNKNLNLSEFYYNLAIQIITICIALRDKKGALLEINELRQYLVSHRKSNDITNLDIEKAIESVSELKCGFQIIDIKNGKAVMTIPMQLSNDTNTIIEIASENKGRVTYTICFEKVNMSKNRFEATINSMIENGVVWIDEQNFINKETSTDDVIYWFPGLLE